MNRGIIRRVIQVQPFAPGLAAGAAQGQDFWLTSHAVRVLVTKTRVLSFALNKQNASRSHAAPDQEQQAAALCRYNPARTVVNSQTRCAICRPRARSRERSPRGDCLSCGAWQSHPAGFRPAFVASRPCFHRPSSTGPEESPAGTQPAVDARRDN